MVIVYPDSASVCATWFWVLNCKCFVLTDELLSCGSESDFTQLFGELQTMKQRVSALPSDQRKACAEQVVMAFWSAIGGDSDEITEPPPGSWTFLQSNLSSIFNFLLNYFPNCLLYFWKFYFLIVIWWKQ